MAFLENGMRREALLSYIDNIVTDISETGISAMLDNIVERFQTVQNGKDTSPALDLQVISTYFSKYQNYSDGEKYIIDVLGIDQAADMRFWQNSLSDLDVTSIYTLRSKVRLALDLLPRIMILLSRSYAEQVDDRHSPRSVVDGTEIQTVILTDEGDALSTPDRLIDVLQSVREIYKAVAIIEGHSPDGIAVVGLDSGSEKSFDFLGMAKVMQEVRALFEFLYTSIAFHRQNASLKNLSVVAEAIPLIQKVEKLRVDKALDEEGASRIKRALINNLEKFASAGAYTPEMKRAVGNSPALIMQSQPRLLTGPAPELGREGNAHDRVIAADQSVVLGDISSSLAGDAAPANNGSSKFTPEQIAAAIALLEEGVEKGATTTSNPAEKETPKPRVRTRRKTKSE